MYFCPSENPNKHIMKKLTFLLMVLLAPFFIQAQQCDSINNHMVDGYSIMPEYAIQLADGTILTRVWQDALDNTGNIQPSLITFYKIARHGAIILDSITYDNPEWNDILMARIQDDDNPAYSQYCNVLAKYLVDQEHSKTDLNLTFFDDDARFNNAMEITVPLVDTIISCFIYESTCMLDSNNDIVFQYVVPSRDAVHFDRFGLDGTLKHRAVIPQSIMPVYHFQNLDGLPIHGLKQSSESPLKYIIYGASGNHFYDTHTDFVAYELDSLFNIVNTLIIPPTDPNTYPFIHNVPFFNGTVGFEDGSFLVARDIRWTTNLQSTGIVKYDSNGEVIHAVWFDSYNVPVSIYGNIAYDDFTGIDLQKDDHGFIYYAFQCVIDEVEVVAIIKLDENLNIIWERYGMHVSRPVVFHRNADCGLKVLNDGGAAVFGSNSRINGHMYPTGMFMMLVDDNGVGVSETGNAIQPYLFSPNPVRDMLHVHYSPDVKPSSIELYDLQGRLLRTQSEGLENIRMDDLPTASYTLRVIMDDGTTYSDIVVKQ